MFLIDKYIPTNKDNIFFHHEIYKILEVMSHDNSIPHLLFHGPVGSGKKTMVRIFLQMLFGESIKVEKNVRYTVSSSGNNETEEEFKQSHHHIFIEPKGNNHDRYLIHDVIKVYVSKARYNIIKSRHKFKVVVINNLDIMSESVQFSLRRTIEKYSEQCRFILISNSISRVINPITSRCKCISVRAPSEIDIVDWANYIGMKESINLSLDKLSHILTVYNGNIKNILWTMEIFKLNQYYLAKIKNGFIEIYRILKAVNIDFKYDKYVGIIIKADYDNIFIAKNISNFVNKLGTEIFLSLRDLFNEVLPNNKFNYYFTHIKDFLNKIDNVVNKKKKCVYYDKKSKYDDCICRVGVVLVDILHTVLLLDPLTSKDYIFRDFYKYIKSCDLKMMNNIRNIIFNLLITNITGTEIIKNTAELIINDERIDSKKKLKILNMCRKSEFGIIKGRREINQFDDLIVSIINILTM